MTVSMFGRLGEPRRKPGQQFDEELREARLAMTRRCSAWTEIEDDLVPRGYRGWSLVSASTDAVYERVRGVVFRSSSASVVADVTPLYFTVDDDGELTF